MANREIATTRGEQTSTASLASGLFQVVENREVGTHRFVRLSPIVARDRLADALAPHIQRAYFNIEQADDRLRTALADLKEFSTSALTISESAIRSALEEELDAVLPAEWKASVESAKHKSRPQQTDVQRSELSEIIAGMVLRDVFETLIPASRVANKEIPDQQARGVDVIGLENSEHITDVVLILGEVKGSCDQQSPPGVVRDMEAKLRKLVTDRRNIVQELIWLRDNCDEQHVQLCAMLCAGYLTRNLDPRVVMAPILIRTKATAGDNDAGRFGSHVTEFSTDVRFVTVALDTQDLFNFAVEVYRKARELAPK